MKKCIWCAAERSSHMEQTHQGPGEFSVSYDREDVRKAVGR
jgi:hypothetical protein